MTAPKIISAEFLLWTEVLLLWSVVSYGFAADPLREEAQRFRWRRWFWVLALRVIVTAAVAYAMTRSIVLSVFLIFMTFVQPLLRFRLPMRWVAEFEALCVAAMIVIPLLYIRHFHLASYWQPRALSGARASAVCLVGTNFLFIVRGGTYIVRGILRKAGTLPSRKQESILEEVTALDVPLSEDGLSMAASMAAPQAGLAIDSESDVEISVDLQELNRGRLIGNLERIVLTIVVAAGSYSALGFLIAAKGLVRFEEFEKSREFTEYFLVGSLSSVLVALCAGLVLRHALLALWPELLAFQMQS
jgi:hypothetical protein